MAAAAPKTEKWTARENLHKPQGLHIIVAGNVEVSDADKAPVLTEGTGAAPKVLALDLAIESCPDPAIQSPVWKAVSLHREVEADEYQGVEVRWDGKPIAKIPVIDDRERAALMDKQTKVQNAIAAKTINVKPAKAGAAETLAATAATVTKAVKKAVKTVLKTVTGSTKKTAKKAAKKTAAKKATKPAKKSAAKKSVRKPVKKLTSAKKKKMERKGKRR
jgi:hypothetical protein